MPPKNLEKCRQKLDRKIDRQSARMSQRREDSDRAAFDDMRRRDRREGLTDKQIAEKVARVQEAEARIKAARALDHIARPKRK